MCLCVCVFVFVFMFVLVFVFVWEALQYNKEQEVHTQDSSPQMHPCTSLMVNNMSVCVCVRRSMVCIWSDIKPPVQQSERGDGSMCVCVCMHAWFLCI